jgi:hypothetical protein
MNPNSLARPLQGDLFGTGFIIQLLTSPPAGDVGGEWNFVGEWGIIRIPRNLG